MPSLRLAKAKKAEFTLVNEHFFDEQNEKIGIFLQTLFGYDIYIIHQIILIRFTNRNRFCPVMRFY